MSVSIIDLLFLLVISSVGWMVYRSFKGEPLIPFMKKEKDDLAAAVNKKTNKSNTTNSTKDIKKLLRNELGIKDIRMDMIWLPKHTYVMALRCDPVNYHLQNAIEQESIDVRFEQWLVSMDYPVVWHLQSRYLDLKHQEEIYMKNLEQDELLTDQAREYGLMVVDYMKRWLSQQSRFEVVRYVLFPYTLSDPGMKRTSNAERALQELYRRVTSAQSFLEGCGVFSTVCKSEDIAEMLYYSMNRKRAAKARFKDVKLNEMLALYCTSPQDSVRVKKVLDDIDNDKAS